jgi:hypothetical protein
MSYGYVYDPVALQEYKKAISWYLKRSEMAMDNFIKSVKEQIVVQAKTLCVTAIPIKSSGKHR